jgi:hypothetical protein
MRADTIGPCTGCGPPHERYGPNGRPHCHECFPSTAAHPRQAEPESEPELSLF